MQIRRLSSLFSPVRYGYCRELFQSPFRALCNLAFMGKSAFSLTLRSGRTAKFSRQGRDHKLWDWYFEHRPPIDFTEDGLVQIEWRGQSVLLRPGTQDFFIFHEIFIDDDYNLSGHDQRLGTVIDLGANAGLFSSALLSKAERVISVEAVGENYRHTLRNLKLNDGVAEDVLHLAVSAHSGETLKLYHNSRNSGGHSVDRNWSEQQSTDTNYETTQSISLADLIAWARCETVDLLKCDIEGSEYDAFLATDEQTLQKIERIVMEVHISETYPPSRLLELIDHLRSAGFQVQLDRDMPTTTATQARMLYADRRHAAATKAA